MLFLTAQLRNAVLGMEAMPAAQCQNQYANKFNQGRKNSAASKWPKSQSKGTKPNFFFLQKPRNCNDRKGAQGSTCHNTNASLHLPLFGMIHVGTFVGLSKS